MFDLIAGLPVHPLVVHLAVVLLPLAALGLVALVVRPQWRDRYAVLTLGALAVGVVAAFVAKESGEALAHRMGTPREHERWGDLVPAFALLLLVVAMLWYAAHRRRHAAAGVVGVAAAVLTVPVLALTVLAGHTGAQAAWAGRVATPVPAPAPAPGQPLPTARPGASTAAPAAPAPGTYSMDQVRQHASASSCWAVVNGSVYDLTAWIARHPGGAGPIEGMCGTDATKAFQAQHNGERRPANELAGFKIGTLAG